MTMRALVVPATRGLMVLVVANILTRYCAGVEVPRASNEGTTIGKVPSWRDCHIFLAPARWEGGGWAVFAGRDFVANEIVEMAPLFLPLEYDTPAVRNSVLDDFIYGYMRLESDASPGKESGSHVHMLANMVLGGTMFYNHGGTPPPNVVYTTFGREPTASQLESANAVGFVAKRAIRAGEELFSNYGEQYSDGGQRWFADRNLILQSVSPAQSTIEQSELASVKQLYCSKIYAGMGQPTFAERLSPLWPDFLPSQWRTLHHQLAPTDAPLDHVVTKSAVRVGERIEITPALVLSRKYHDLENTALATLVFFWDDLTPDHQETLRQLRHGDDSLGSYAVQYQGALSEWKRTDRWSRVEDVAILAAAGSLAMVNRVGTRDGYRESSIGGTANCRLVIRSARYGWSGSSGTNTSKFQLLDGNAGLVLELIATADLDVGTVLRLNLPQTVGSHSQLRRVLQETGQPLPTKDILPRNESNSIRSDLYPSTVKPDEL